MPEWESIIFDDPTSEHAMLPRVVQVMKCIYSTVDPALSPPSTVDTWWHSLSLSYQVGSSGREPSIVILNLREGEADDPIMSTHFMINLNTMRVHDKFMNHRFPVPQEILSVLEGLREYVWSTAFYRCLVEKGLIDEDDAEYFFSDMHCPVCSAKYTSCNLCKIISCSNGDCKVSSAIPLLRCSNHRDTKFCTSCLECPGSLPRLGKCPTCARWLCAKELEWCIGRPVSNGDTSNTGPSPSDIDVTRLHPARLLSCQSVACRANSQESGKYGRQCCNTGCWSRVGATTCPDCITQDSFSCPCGRYWACGGCASSIGGIHTCPGCHRRFCLSCSYIGVCELCGDVGLCHDCLEEDENVEVEHTPYAELAFKCQNCRGLLCKTCADIDERSCYKCGRSLCKICGTDAHYGDVCDECGESTAQFDLFHERHYYDYDDEDITCYDEDMAHYYDDLY
ncbi:hypothetical protein DFH29DRAFT_925377 [Suillus ampliporus]|nr:hypothetical protein DFH29DRAFT_925377 [Suillus ampliporus]